MTEAKSVLHKLLQYKDESKEKSNGSYPYIKLNMI